MSLLAEPRKKQRISIDPQNLNWANDEKRFGKKMMKQMGWNGEGLGPNGNGIKNCIKTKHNNDQRGLGATNNNCVPHQDEYAQILADLNKARKIKNKTEINSEEKRLEKNKKLRKRKIEENQRINEQVNNLTMDQYFAQKLAKIREKKKKN
ncbi:G-patch domain-containing protein [Meloidogyne graminicola]|uniref:G patch domain-containing protein 4 n=1 Tax=Meloidogyne graminicola TaxID=189291 RepID=A0A8S9ZKW8_9BILA|nr:G-patch domain-containing protein [Meloidogyne graminicola]